MPDPNEKTEMIEEKMGMGENNVDIIEDQRKERLEDQIKNEIAYQKKDSEDQEEPMTLERKIHLLAKVFPFALGDRVRNRHMEDGFIEMVGLDDRGVCYLVRYKENRSVWETEQHIKKAKFGSDKPEEIEESLGVKTDIPDPKKKPNEITSGYSPELG